MLTDSILTVDDYLQAVWLSRGLSENTLAAYRRDLEFTVRALAPLQLSAATAGQLADIMARRYEQGLSPRSTARWLSTLRGYFRHLVRESLAAEDPTAELRHPRFGRPLPKTMSMTQVEALLNAPDTSQALGLRDRAMLELLYSSGLRISELINLEMPHLNRRQGVVRVLGKGNKERLIPVGDEALRWLDNYLADAREDLVERALRRFFRVD